MSAYYFATFHQKKTIAPTCNKGSQTPRQVRDAASSARQAVIKAFENLYNHTSYLDQEPLLTEVRQLSENYLGWVHKLQEMGFNRELYCYWGESIAPRVNHAFNDLNYDAANIIFNRAVVLMNHANYILTYNVSVRNLESNEKDAYASLCLAAGDFKLARELVSKVSLETAEGGSKTNTLLADVTPEFLEMMETLCLAQAQEIGASKACRKDDSHDKDERKTKHGLVAKLTHQCFVLFSDACKIAVRKVVCPTEKFAKLIKFLEVKSAVYEGLTCAYTASTMYDDKPEDALWLVKRSYELTSPVRQIVEKAKFDHYVSSFLDGAEQTQRHIQDRIESMNRMVVRAKAAEGPIAYPPAQVLARAKEVEMPPPATVASDGFAAVDETHQEWDVVNGDQVKPSGEGEKKQ